MPYKRVIAFGDSFTRGDELADCSTNGRIAPHHTYSLSTWSALIAKELGIEYDSMTIGGRGNHWISMSVSTYLEKHRDALFIINWSWFERFDYIDAETAQWTVTHPRHNDQLNHYFYKHIDNEKWNLHRNLQQIHSTICLLEQNNINFIMTCMDPMLYNKENFVTVLQKQVNHYIVDFEDMSFLEWSKHKSFELGPNGHPLEKAHAEAAKYINTSVIEGITNGHR
jgi:hypothetical protein